MKPKGEGPRALSRWLGGPIAAFGCVLFVAASWCDLGLRVQTAGALMALLGIPIMLGLLPPREPGAAEKRNNEPREADLPVDQVPSPDDPD